MSTNPPKKVNFHFVTGNPQTDTEKRTVRTIVRSNASNRRWRLVRETAAKSKADGSNPSESSASPESGSSETLPSRSSSVSDEKEKFLRRQKLAERGARRLSRSDSNEDVPPLESPVKTVNLPQYYLGPIALSEVSMRTISRVLQGSAASYAQLLPAGKGGLVSPMAKEWFQGCLRTRGILHTAMFCQERRAQAIRPGSVAMTGNELMLCQTEAVHAINDKLLSESTATDDESLRIVLSLAWHGPVKKAPFRRTPRQVPLGDLQSLRLFMGVIACDPVHAHGLDRMLALRGGLDTVELPGLAFLISYADIIGASCHLRRPTWDYGSYAKCNPDAVVGDEWVQSTRRADHPLTTLGAGFSALRLWTTYERASQLQFVSNGMAEYTRASHGFIQQSPADRNKAVMADQRNTWQHRLMSLCLLPEDDFEGRDLFEVVWLAAVAYSLIAVFPLAPNAAQFDRLARLIREKMSNPQLAAHWSQAPDLVLWIVVMGAVCAIGTNDRAWYVNALRQERDRLGVLNWTNLKARLMEFLWFPFVSDSDGLDLWEEIQQSGYVMPWESTTPTEDLPAFEAFHVRSRSGSATTPVLTNR